MPARRASHRRARRRGRVAVLAAAVAVSVGIGSVATGVVPDVTGGSAAVGSTPRATLETAALDTVVAPMPEPAVAIPTPDPTVPVDSGTGRRIVFDQGDQRVWLVDVDGAVERTYLVSGSRFDNLRTGTYAVQSRSRTATAFDGSGTMEYFVRFATGFSEPIGFHSVPVDRAGHLEQTREQLGTRLSAGCVRQWEPDAVALWDFAPVGTTVVVTA